MKIQLLGQFQVEYEGRPVDGLQTPRLQALLAYLLLNRERPISREQIAFTLWPDSNEANARNNLRRLLHRLRQQLPDADRYLDITSQIVRWRTDSPLTLDLAVFEAAATAAPERPSWEEALPHYAGPLLPHLFDDWIIEAREKYRQLWLEGLAAAARSAEQRGELDEALRYVRRLAESEQLHEAYTRWLMRLHAWQGDRAAALQVYEACIANLREGLGVPPSRPTRELHEQILNGASPDLSILGRDPAPPAALPRYHTPFVGREEALAQLEERLARDEMRLLTVTGPGGSGKTRLVVEAARQAQPLFQADPIFVSLAAVSSDRVLLSAVAGALGITFDSDQGQQDPQQQLVNVLGRRSGLLIFDNFEHLLPAALPLVEAILNQAPACKLLITSRERLNLPGKWLLELQGLPFPRELDPEETAARLPAFGAARMFVQLARQALAEFDPRPVDWLAIYEICQLTGGLPLAIELAVPWVRVLSCAEIARRLRESLDLLAADVNGGEAARRRSVVASLDYSWRLLAVREQELLRRLTVFQGPFTPAAAAGICGTGLADCRLFLDRSLLQATAAGLFDLHPLLRQYLRSYHGGPAAAQAEITGRHAAYYVAHLTAAGQKLQAARRRGERPDGLIYELIAEIDNIRAAAERLLEPEPPAALAGIDPADLLSFVDSFVLLLQYEGWFDEGVAFLERFVQVTSGLEPLDAGRYRRLLGEFYLSLGRMADGRATLHDGLGLLDFGVPTGDAALSGQLLIQAGHRLWRRPAARPEQGARMVEGALILDQLARVNFVEGRRLRSIYYGLKGLNLVERTGHIALRARGYGQVCVGMGLAGRHGPARRYYERARAMVSRIDDALDRAYALRVLAAYDIIVARWETAEILLEEAIQIYDRVGKQQLWGECYTALNQATIAQGDFIKSLQLWSELNSGAKRTGNAIQEAWALNGWGSTLLFLGQTEEALANLEQGLRLVERLDYAPGRITARSMLALAYWRAGEPQRARQLADATFELSRQDPPPLITVVLAQANLAEVYLGLLDGPAAGGIGASLTGQIRSPARQSVDVLQKLTWAYRAGRPRALIFSGLLHQAEGRPRQTRHLLPGAPERAALLARAARLFTRIGASHDLERVREM